MEDYSTDQKISLDLSRDSINLNNKKKSCTVTSKDLKERKQDKSNEIPDWSIENEIAYHAPDLLSPKEMDLNHSLRTVSISESTVTQILKKPNLSVKLSSSSDVEVESIENISEGSSFLHDLDNKSISPSKKRPRSSSPISKKKKKNESTLSPECASNISIKTLSKSMKPPCNCAFECYNKIDNNERINIFQYFWNLENRQKQLEFILNHTVKLKRCPRGIPNYTFKHKLPKISDGKTIRVCTTMFLNTLMVHRKLVRTTWEKFENGDIDKNGYSNKKIKNGNTIVESVRDHISSLCPIKIKYFGNNPDQLGSDEILNVMLSSLFESYSKWVDPHKYSHRVTTEIEYKKIARKNVNIDFHFLEQDQSDIPGDIHSYDEKPQKSKKFSIQCLLHCTENIFNNSQFEPCINDKKSNEGNLNNLNSVSSPCFLFTINLNLTNLFEESQQNTERNDTIPLDNEHNLSLQRVETLVTKVLVEGNSIEAPCVCSDKCYKKINYNERTNLSKCYLELRLTRKQFEFIIMYTEKHEHKECISTHYPTFKYKLPVFPIDRTYNVCEQMFLNTLIISIETVKKAWENFEEGRLLVQNNRDFQKNEEYKKSIIKSVCDHVNSFAPVEAHFLGKNPNKLYLDGSLNMSVMFRLYKKWFNPNKYPYRLTIGRKYREIVGKNFNLDFHVIKKDECDECQAFRELKDPNDEQTARHIIHKENIVSVNNKKKRDIKDAKTSKGKIMTAIFEIEKVLACPHDKENRFHNKRKFLCFMFTILDLRLRRPICYMWDECVAKNEGDDISSCLLKFINFHIENGVEEFRFWSYNDESRNSVIFCLYSYIVSKYKVNIYHNFHIKEHTKSELANVDHIIEKLSSTKDIFTPEEWQNLVKCAKSKKKSKEPFEVMNLTQDDFYNFTINVNCLQLQKDNAGKTISWSEVREVFFSNENLSKIKFRYDYNEDYKVIDLAKDLKFFEISCKYGKVLPLPCIKYEDLMNICNSEAIPEKYITFYKNLPHENYENTNQEKN